MIIHSLWIRSHTKSLKNVLRILKNQSKCLIYTMFSVQLKPVLLIVIKLWLEMRLNIHSKVIISFIQIKCVVSNQKVTNMCIWLKKEKQFLSKVVQMWFHISKFRQLDKEKHTETHLDLCKMDYKLILQALFTFHKEIIVLFW